MESRSEVRYMAPRKGKASDQLLKMLQEWLEKNGGLVVVLDEFGQLDDQAEVVYNLHQCSKATGTPLGLVLVSNKPPDEIQLDPRAASRLCYQTIQFQPYGQEELVNISVIGRT